MVRRLLLAALALSLFAACGALPATGDPVEEPPPAALERPDGPSAPLDATPEVVFPSVAVSVELALTDAERARGLGGHAPLGETEGMLFVFPTAERHAFWMRGMTFPLDIIWIDEGRVVHVERDVPPPPAPDAPGGLPIYVPAAPARYVLEVNAGFSVTHGIEVGTEVSLHGIAPPAG